MPSPLAGETEAVRRRRRDADRGAERIAEHALRLIAARADLGAVADDLHRRVADPPACRAGAPRARRGRRPRGRRPTRAPRAEQPADVAQPGCREDRIGEGVGDASPSECPAKPSSSPGQSRPASHMGGRPRRDGRRCRCRRAQMSQVDHAVRSAALGVAREDGGVTTRRSILSGLLAAAAAMTASEGLAALFNLRESPVAGRRPVRHQAHARADRGTHHQRRRPRRQATGGVERRGRDPVAGCARRSVVAPGPEAYAVVGALVLAGLGSGAGSSAR